MIYNNIYFFRNAEVAHRKPQWIVIEVLFTRNPILFIPQPVNLVIDFFIHFFLVCTLEKVVLN